jgi:cytochrome c-type biogenesis protein CcmH/NrfG
MYLSQVCASSRVSSCSLARANQLSACCGRFCLWYAIPTSSCTSPVFARLALLRRAKALFTALSPDETIALLERAVQQNPDNFAANLWLAESLMQRGRLEEAHGYYAHALELRAQDPRARRGPQLLLRRLGRPE